MTQAGGAPAGRVGRASIKVDGAPLPKTVESELIEVRVEQSVQVPTRFTLRFRDPSFAVLDADHFAVGKAVDIAFTNGTNEAAVLTRGEVTSITVEQGASGRHELAVSGLDRGHRLARGTTVRTFVKMTDVDVVRKIASEAGLSLTADASAMKHEYLLQDTSNYEFVSARAQAIGFEWWVDGTKLFFKKRAKAGTSPELRWGTSLRRFKLRYSASEFATDVQVRAWDPKTHKAIVAKAEMKSATAPVARLGTTAKAGSDGMKAAASMFTGSRLLATVPVESQDEATALANSLAGRATAQQVRAKGEAVGDPRLKAGTVVTLSGLGAKLSGDYVLSSVEHVIGPAQPYITRFTVGGADPTSLVDLLGGRGDGGRVPAGGGQAAWGRHGLVVGLVTNISDPEKLGRVKVKFPALGDSDESAWARVLTVGAGASRGFHVPYEVDDEVFVAFEHGHVNRPVIVGGVSSQKSPPPTGTYITGGKVVSRKWQSRVGHVIELHDGTGPTENYVSVKLKDGQTELKLAEDKITITAPKDMAINVTGRLDIQAMAVSIKAKTQMAVEGKMTELKGTATMKVEGGATAEVKAGIVKLN